MRVGITARAQTARSRSARHDNQQRHSTRSHKQDYCCPVTCHKPQKNSVYHQLDRWFPAPARTSLEGQGSLLSSTTTSFTRRCWSVTGHAAGCVSFTLLFAHYFVSPLILSSLAPEQPCKVEGTTRGEPPRLPSPQPRASSRRIPWSREQGVGCKRQLRLRSSSRTKRCCWCLGCGISHTKNT